MLMIENGIKNIGLTIDVKTIAPIMFKLVWMASNKTLGKISSTELLLKDRIKNELN